MTTGFFTLVLLALGVAFILIAALGIVRMPDIFTRMHSATKAASLGAGLMLLAAAFHFGSLGVATKAGATILFIFLTAPVASHMIGRAAYLRQEKGVDPQARLEDTPPSLARLEPDNDG